MSWASPFVQDKKGWVWVGRKEGNDLFNDALNTFYLRLYGVRHMVKDHSDSERGNPLPPHRLLFPISSKGSFICTIPDRIVHTTAFVTPVVEHWLEREIAQWVHPMKDRSDDPSHHERTLYLWATTRSWVGRRPALPPRITDSESDNGSNSWQVNRGLCFCSSMVIDKLYIAYLTLPICMCNARGNAMLIFLIKTTQDFPLTTT